MVKKDKNSTKKMIIIVSIFAVFVTIILFSLRFYADSIIKWILQNPNDVLFRMRIIFVPVVVFMSLPLFWFGVYFWTVGSKVEKLEIFPLSNKDALKEAETIYGQDAIKRGRLLKFLAIIVVSVAFVILIGIWELTGLMVK
jgi:hypothetical protein